MTQMCTHFKTKTDVTQNLTNKFFSNFTVRGPSDRKDFKWEKIWGYRLISDKTEAIMNSIKF